MAGYSRLKRGKIDAKQALGIFQNLLGQYKKTAVMASFTAVFYWLIKTGFYLTQIGGDNAQDFLRGGSHFWLAFFI